MGSSRAPRSTPTRETPGSRPSSRASARRSKNICASSASPGLSTWRSRGASAMDWNKGLVKHLGIRVVEAGPERVIAELDVREELKTLGTAVHGGTLMALADTVGAMGTVAIGLKTATL